MHGSYSASFAFQAAPSFAVIELPSNYPQWNAVDGETGKFESFSPESEPFEERSRGKEDECLCDQAAACDVRASPD